MKDSLDILMPSEPDEYVAHYGIAGMKWGVRKKDDTKGTTKGAKTIYRPATTRKKKVTEGNGSGVHKRGEGLNIVNATGDVGVGGFGSYHNSVNVYGTGTAPISSALGQELRKAILKEIIASEEYKNIKQLMDQFEKLAAERKKYWNNGNSTAANMVFEEKASALIRKINSNLTAIDSKYAEKSKLVRQTADKTYKPSKELINGAFLESSSGALNIDKKTGRVTKGWRSAPSLPKNSGGKKF